MPDEEIVSGSQTETTPAPERDAETEALYASFDIKPAAPKKEIEFPDLSKGQVPAQETEETKTSAESDPPAKEEAPAETKKIKVKHNKEEVEVDISTDEKLTDHLQRSLALDKERERKTELEKHLDRAAKLAGYKDHSEYVANFDKIEQQHRQKEQDAHKQLIAELRQQANDAGLDPDSVQSYLDNHPLVKEGQRAKEERETERLELEKERVTAETHSKWNELYAKYADLIEDSHAFNRGETPSFYTAEMQSRVAKGYDPIDAYELAHRDKISAQTKKAAEQKVIKQHHLGTRSAVEGQAATQPDEVTLLPEQMALAAEFGVNLDGVRRQQKLLTSRR